MKKMNFAKIVLLISFLFMISCNEEDDTTENNQEQEEQIIQQLPITVCDYDPNDLLGSFDWLEELIDDDVVEITLRKAEKEWNGEIKKFYYVVVSKNVEKVDSDGNVYHIVGHELYTCSGEKDSYFYFFDISDYRSWKYYTSPEEGPGKIYLPNQLITIETIYSNPSNQLDVSKPIEEIPWLNAKKNELENSDKNTMIRIFTFAGYKYYMINECLECAQLRRFKVYNFKGEYAGTFGNNNYVASTDAFNSVLVNMRGELGDKLFYNIINTTDCEVDESLLGDFYKYHGQTIRKNKVFDGTAYYNCDGEGISITAMFNVNDPFPDWDEEAILLE
ncbi:hypothetical protein [Aureivirga marina]|uniref:hypothetical protein n=1 Tax=Aureivirga marina TaxID=1182451 RepID=UPI0018CAC050|nr:hypothetical protein [Aureivirga marina]